ncbi:MAG TPA: dihydroneopterin aldolase [Acidimicrobiia bacterium]|nr:dihydroneopterin aldolase [Acidimicrobiia bacterium]
MDRLQLTGIEVFAHHGVLPEEKQIGQKFLIDLDIEADLKAAGKSDSLADTIDYGDLAEKVHDLVAGSQWNLIEKVAEEIAQLVLAIPLVRAVAVTVHKPNAPIAVDFDDVSVTTIHRRRG